jgi:hypothetical protein
VVSDEVRQCQGITKKGKRCRRSAKAGSDYCGLHDGSGAKAGAPVRNQNARKHGFYARYITAEERDDLAVISALGLSLEGEIALLRVRLRRSLKEGVELSVISRALGRLTQMMKAQKVISGDAASEWEEAMADVLSELAEELGLGLNGS